MAEFTSSTTYHSQIACGLTHSLVCTDSGKIVSFGGGSKGQLGQYEKLDNSGLPKIMDANQCKNDEKGDRMVSASSPPMLQVAAGEYHTAALRKDGFVYTWGSNSNGRLGHGEDHEEAKSNNKNSSPRVIRSLRDTPIVQVSCGADFTLVVDNSGSVYSWGLGNYGNLGHGDTQDHYTPKPIYRLKSEVIRMVAGGAKHSLAVSQSGDVWAFGHGDNGRLGNNATQGSLVPERAKGKVTTENCIFIAAGESHSACIDDHGHVYTWGTGTYGRLGSGGENDQLVPMIVDSLAKIDSVTVACGAFHTCVLTVAGDIWSFGGGLYGKLGLGGQENSMIPVKLPRLQNNTAWTQVSCGSFHTLGISENGVVHAWGFGGHGRLGQNKEIDMTSTPTAITLDAQSHKCSGSSTRRFQTLVTKQAHTYQEEGDQQDNNEPATRIIDVGAGAKHSMYCTSQGHVYTWGANDCGQLGNRRNGVDPSIPAQVKAHVGGLRIVSVACGANHCMCVTARGDLYTWGLGTSGQLGHGSMDNMDSPNVIQLLQGKNIVLAVGGEDNSGCVTDTGDLYTWGAGEMGKLGHGPGITSSLLPRLIRGDLQDKNVKQLSLGLGHTAVIVNQGTLYSWGAGWFGRLGHGDTNNVYVPKKIESLVYKRFKTVSCGSYHTIAVTYDNECYTWGRGDERLGIMARRNQLLPTIIESLSSRHLNIDYAVASEEHSVVVTVNGTVYAFGLGKYCKLGISEPDAKNKEEDCAIPNKVLSLYQKGYDVVTLCLGDAPKDVGGLNSSGQTKVDRRKVKSLSNHNIALDSSGTVWVWGCAGQGRLGVQHATKSIPLAVPRDIAFHEDIYGDGSAGADAAGKRTASKVEGGAFSFGETKDSSSDRSSDVRRGEVRRGGTPGDIDDVVMRFRRDRTNPSANFVHRLLKVEPTANRAQNIELMRSQIVEDRKKIEDYMFDVSELEEQVKDLETEVEVLIKSTIKKRVPSGLFDNRSLVPDDIIDHHSTFAKIFEMLLANPYYLKEMHKYYTHQSPEMISMWEKEGYQLASTFKRRFAKLSLSVYGDVSRERNEHLFLTHCRNVMLEELIQHDGTYDMAKATSEFNGSGSVFGELVRNYFSLDRCVDNISDRYKEVFLELVTKTDNGEYNFEYDPIQIYLEQNVAGEGAVRGALGKGQKFDDAYREDLYQSLGSVKNKVNVRISKMSEVALQWITYTTSTVSGIPDGVRWICRQLMEELTKQYGNSANSSELTVAHFLFDMYFRPGIINPGSYGMMDGRKKLSRQVVKNLHEMANLVKRALTQTLFHQDRARWMSEANGVIEQQHKPSLLWIREVVKIDLHLPEKMLNDVYIEQLGHGRVTHTIDLSEVQLLRWMLLEFNRFSAAAYDPLQPYVTGSFGIAPNGICRNAKEWLARPDASSNIGINFQLNYRYFKIMKRDLIRLSDNDVPLPHYLAGRDSRMVKDLFIDAEALDEKRLAFASWLRGPSTADFSLPEDDSISGVHKVKDRIHTEKSTIHDDGIKSGKENFDQLSQLSLISELLDQLEAEKTPLSQVMGELLEQYAERSNIAERQKQQLDASHILFVRVHAYADRLRARIIALTNYLEGLTRDGKSSNYDQAAQAARKLSKKLAKPNMVRDAHSTGKKNVLKKKLARNNELHGSHRSFTFAELKKAEVIIGFELHAQGGQGKDELPISKKELKRTKQKLVYMVSSTQPGVFRVICVFDKDTVLDHFDINISSLLEQERSMKNQFRPGFSIQTKTDDDIDEAETKTFGHVAKTSFHIKNLLQRLEAMSINYKMLQVE